MLFIQMTGLSGAGKTSIGSHAVAALKELGYRAELLDADEYRKDLCRDLGYSRADRLENIRRMGFVGVTLARQGIITIMAAINPYAEGRDLLSDRGALVKTVFIDCPIQVTRARDTKGLYRKANLPVSDAEHVGQFTGVTHPYEVPVLPDLILHTDQETLEDSVNKMVSFILKNVAYITGSP